MFHGRKEDGDRFIGGYQIEFVRRRGWRCNCRAWELTQKCSHVLLVAALRTLEKAVAAHGGSIRRH